MPGRTAPGPVETGGCRSRGLGGVGWGWPCRVAGSWVGRMGGVRAGAVRCWRWLPHRQAARPVRRCHWHRLGHEDVISRQLDADRLDAVRTGGCAARRQGDPAGYQPAPAGRRVHGMTKIASQGNHHHTGERGHPSTHPDHRIPWMAGNRCAPAAVAAVVAGGLMTARVTHGLATAGLRKACPPARTRPFACTPRDEGRRLPLFLINRRATGMSGARTGLRSW
jgi:hypothetical protein